MSNPSCHACGAPILIGEPITLYHKNCNCFAISLDEIIAINKWFEHEFLGHHDEVLHDVIQRIQSFLSSK